MQEQASGSNIEEEFDSHGRFCLSPIVFGLIIAILSIVLISSLVAALLFFIKRSPTKST